MAAAEKTFFFNSRRTAGTIGPLPATNIVECPIRIEDAVTSMTADIKTRPVYASW
jgi:hypothetical protein